MAKTVTSPLEGKEKRRREKEQTYEKTDKGIVKTGRIDCNNVYECTDINQTQIVKKGNNWHLASFL